ncbi:CHASE domain-containing protein [Pseudocolwellia agarivorans]|uniref:CHASE domain-containing protein n=1 Tax=Pseudocolwellia agarivorans TaxID=1911682 RepID=UPI000985221A|nr:CHASE domain-containing protein [Pseudocolwellia agarivorans]
MKKQIYQPVFAICMYVIVCLLTIMMIKPFSMIVFLGSSAGIASAIIILWGSRQLFSVVLASIIFNTFLYFYLSVEFELAVVMISLLATCLQALWAKKLTYQMVTQGQWLDSRVKLSVFLFKIGPLVSLISAFASVLIAVLSVKTFDVNLFYIFCRTWSMSILISIFVIPVLLFLKKEHNFNKGKQLFVITSSVLGALSIALLFKIFQDQHQHYRNDDFYKAQTHITTEFERKLLIIEQQLNALKAYFEASKLINLESFNQFSANILSDSSMIESLEWAPVVKNKYRDSYEKYMSEVLDTHYVISQQTLMGNTVKINDAPIYMPVQYVFPRYQNEEILGIDLLSHIDKKNAIEEAINSGEISATLPINMIEGDFTNPAILIVLPVYNSNLTPDFGKYNQKGKSSTSGVVVAVVRISSLFNNIDRFINENNINLLIKDVNNHDYFTIIGQEFDATNKLVNQYDSNVFSRKWNTQISEKYTWVLQDKTWQTWMMLFGGTFGGLVFQLLILMMAAYSTELSNKVTQKTRELILSKEKSDNENQAKTDFLQSLSTELRVPLSVIKRLIEVFPKKNLAEIEKEYIDNISNASLNLEQLIDTLNELSSIESGRLTLNNQSFDFILFLKRMEEIVEAQAKNIKFLIQEDVPQFIESDELRLQQVFITCAENAKELLDNNNICISVKVHFHHQNSATIVFVLHALRTNNSIQDASVVINNNPEGIKFNLRMEMAKELCNKLGGNINIAQLPSGESMIHVSVKVKISQEQEVGLGRFNIPSINHNTALNVKRILFVEGKNKTNKNLYRQLVSLKFYVDVITDVKEIDAKLSTKEYHLVIFDCSESDMNIAAIPSPIKGEFSRTPTIALFNQALENKMLSLVNHKFTSYMVLPMTTENLRNLLANYLK